MEKDPFVEYSRNRLENFQSDINGEDIWTNIKDDVTTKKRKRRGFWWVFSFSSILLFVLVVGFTLLSHNRFFQDKSLVNQVQKDELQAIEDTSNISAKNPLKNLPIRKDIMASKINQVNTQESKKSTNFKHLEQKRTNSAVLLLESENERNELNQKLELNSNEDLKKEKFDWKNFTLIEPISVKNDDNGLQQNFKDEDLINKLNSESIEKIPYLAIEQVKLTTQLLHDFDLILAPMPQEEMNTAKSNTGFKLSFYGGLLRFNTKHSSTSSDHLLLLEKRKETEKDLTSYKFGFNLSKEIKNGFYVSCGLEYGNKRSQFNFNGDIVTLDSVEQPVLVIINPFTGVTENHFGKSLETTTTTYNKSISNEIHFLNIPFGIGYNYNIGNWNFGIEPGLTVNLLTKYKGQIFNEDLSGFYYLENDKNDLFSKRTNLVFRGDFHLGYQISNSLEIYSVFSYYDQTGVSNNSNVIDESFRGFGISSGMRFNL